MIKRFCKFGPFALIWLATSAARADSPDFYSYTSALMGRFFEQFNASSVISLTEVPFGGASSLDSAADGTLFGADGAFLRIIDRQRGLPTNSVPFSAVPSGALTITAISFDPNGTLYGSSGGSLYTIDRASGLCAKVGDFSPASGVVGFIEFGPDGTLYGTVGSSLVKINPVTAVVSAIGTPQYRGGPMPLGDCQRAVKTSQGWADENRPL